jgi:hypothetical protein
MYHHVWHTQVWWSEAIEWRALQTLADDPSEPLGLSWCRNRPDLRLTAGAADHRLSCRVVQHRELPPGTTQREWLARGCGEAPALEPQVGHSTQTPHFLQHILYLYLYTLTIKSVCCPHLVQCKAARYRKNQHEVREVTPTLPEGGPRPSNVDT